MPRTILRTRGAEYTLDVTDQGVVSVSGQPSPISVRDAGSGLALVETDGRIVRAFVAGSGDTRWVFVEGEVWELDVVHPGVERRVRAGRHEEGLVAPMPATVLKIAVTSGDVVEQGRVLIVLEAMKMELPLRAPRGGTVRAIHCEPGELVQPGVVLIEIV